MRDRILSIGRATRKFIVEHLLDDVCGGDASLTCACAVASYVNDRILTIAGFDSRLMLGQWDTHGHCWTEVRSNGVCLCLDVTATQFGRYDDVILLPKNAYFALGFMHDMKTSSRARPTTSFVDWGEQSPAHHARVIENFVNHFNENSPA